jgi:hypothetical protein
MPAESRKERSMMKQLAFVLAVACAAPLGSAQAQTELKAYADADGYINVQKLTCAQLAGTYQEDANFLGVWYSGWYNGLGKKSSINLPRVREGIHELIVYCKANQGTTIIKAIDVLLKAEKVRTAK